jgi:UDP-2-acetamido-3-amino-2,3-dideoxy-glucuronate N-acetyltransferase
VSQPPSGETFPRDVCVVGAGRWGRNLVRNFHALGALRMVCDAGEEALAGALQAAPGAIGVRSLTEALRDPEVRALVIASPAEMHAAMAHEALSADRDVFVEKPLALALAEGRALVELAERRGRTLMVGHLLQYHPAVDRLREMIEAGELGKLQYAYSNRLNLGRIRSEENILWSFAPHDIDVLLLLLGERPARVSAHGGCYLHHRIADVTVSTLEFPSGVRAHIFVSWLHPVKEQRLILVGDRRMAVFDDQADHKLVVYPHTIEWKGRQPIPVPGTATPVPVPVEEPLRRECLEFLRARRDRRPPRTDGPSGLRVLEVLEACQRSLESNGEPVALPAAGEAYFVHPTATVDAPVRIGRGTKIWHYTHVMRDATIGENCVLGQNVMVYSGVVVGDNVKIQDNVSLYKGVTLADHVFCGPSMVFTNVINPRSEISRRDQFRDTPVGRGASLGANCTILCGNPIGDYAFVGAGAVVTRPVPAYALVVGNPARQIGWVCRCGERLRDPGPDLGCDACGRAYRLEEGRLLATGAAPART